MVVRLVLRIALALVAAACGRAGYDPIDQGDDSAGADDGGGGGDVDASVFTAGEAGDDTFLASNQRGFIFGALEVLRTARGPAATILLRFDLGEVPPGAEPSGATLAVWTSDAAQDASEVRIYRVFEDWREGNEVGAPGEASWDNRAPGNSWSSPGCGVGSRDAAARAEIAIDAPATLYEVELPASVVQGWIDDPASNRGLALIATGGAGVELVSSESPDPARRPALSVEWSSR
jgi:hypothetical protein